MDIRIRKAALFAKTHPHAAYAVYTHGLSHQWKFLLRTVPGIDNLLSPLEAAICNLLIPVFTRKCKVSDNAKDVLALPSHLGGLSLTNPQDKCNHEYAVSCKVSSNLNLSMRTGECVLHTELASTDALSGSRPGVHCIMKGGLMQEESMLVYWQSRKPARCSLYSSQVPHPLQLCRQLPLQSFDLVRSSLYFLSADHLFALSLLIHGF